MKNLTEKEAEDLLEKHGFNVVKRIIVKNNHEISKAEQKIKFPWVMKISSKHIAHKAKIGGTILGINSLEEALRSFHKLSQIEDFEGVLIQPMILGQELILGIKKTPEFSQVIMFGKGGTDVEKEKDVSFRIVPIKAKDAKEMIRETNIYKTIKLKINEKLLIKNLMKISELIEHNPKIIELDINPLIINEKEAVVVDARLQLE